MSVRSTGVSPTDSRSFYEWVNIMSEEKKKELFFNKWNDKEVTLKELENMIKEMPKGLFLRIQKPMEDKYG